MSKGILVSLKCQPFLHSRSLQSSRMVDRSPSSPLTRAHLSSPRPPDGVLAWKTEPLGRAPSSCGNISASNAALKLFQPATLILFEVLEALCEAQSAKDIFGSTLMPFLLDTLELSLLLLHSTRPLSATESFSN